VSPSTILQGTTTDFSVRVMHTASGGNLGCAIIDVPASFTVLYSDITGTSNGTLWSLSRSGNRVQVNSNGGDDKLTQGEWIEFGVLANPTQAGSFAWLGWASPSPSCGGEPTYLTDQSASVAVTSPGGTSTPAPDPVVSGWSLTIGPTAVLPGSTTDFTLRLTDTDGSGDIGCLRMQVASGFTVLSATVTGTNQPAAWSAGTFNNFVWVRNPDGDGKLTAGEWVDFTVRARADQIGSQGWSGFVVQNSTCFGSPFLDPITLQVQITPVATPTPTPTPAPVSTPEATPTPVPAPDPIPVPPPPPPPAMPSETIAPTPSPTPIAVASEEHVIPLAEDPNAGEPPFTPVRVEAPDPPQAAPAAPTPAPAAPDLLSQIVDAAAEGIGRAVSPEAAAQVAATFGFPLGLMLAVLLFLIAQDRVDRRDPKLREAPRNVFDTVVRFKEEHEL
jgi:hypothetical protein